MAASASRLDSSLSSDLRWTAHVGHRAFFFGLSLASIIVRRWLALRGLAGAGTCILVDRHVAHHTPVLIAGWKGGSRFLPDTDLYR